MQLRNRATGEGSKKVPPRTPRSTREAIDGLLSSSSSYNEASSEDSDDDFFKLKIVDSPAPKEEGDQKASMNDGLLTPSDSADDIPTDKKMSPPPPANKEDSQLLSSPLVARSLKKEDLYPTSESDVESGRKPSPLPVLETDKTRSVSCLQSSPQLDVLIDSSLAVARMPSAPEPATADSSDSDVQFVKKRLRKLTKCTTYRPSETTGDALQAEVHGELKEADNLKTVFSNDPVRSPPLQASTDEINALGKSNFLTTNLLDYLTQLAVPKDLPDHILIGSSNSLFFFEVQNEKVNHQV